nr:MAG TPA: hypothetical protein [Caudoviricetes sp.]
MITKDEFITLINDYQKWSEQVDKASEVLGISTLFESNLIDYTSRLFDKTINILFDENGTDDIYWWLYEKSGNPDFKMWDENGKEIPTDTVEDLWNIVEKFRK